MTLILIGLGMLAVLVGLFWLKNTLRSPWLGRLAYSEPVARLAIVAFALILIGAIVTVGSLF
jgi:uncharacterized membrane protein (DUF485 family)